MNVMTRRLVFPIILSLLNSCFRSGGAENRRIAADFAEALARGDTATIRRLAVAERVDFLMRYLPPPLDKRLSFDHHPPSVSFRMRDQDGARFFVRSSSDPEMGVFILVRERPKAGVVAYQVVPDLYHPRQ